MTTASDEAGMSGSAVGWAGSPAAERSLRVLLVDDHPVLRAGLRALLAAHPEFDIVGEADSGEGALTLTRAVRPHVVLLDIALPGMSGADAARRLKQEAPETRVLALSAHDELAIVHDVLDAGADGYLLKSTACDELVHALRQVVAGNGYVDVALARHTSQSRSRGSSRPPVERLSEREAQVAKLLANGFVMKEIAVQLKVSPRTLESYRARAFQKLGLKSRADLVRFAIRCGWLAAG